jgi:ribosomal protein S18 acetylase RimI-like enzyme
LCLAAIQAAREAGYLAMRLDTLASMTPAVTLYESLGFRRIAAYYDNPLPDVRYFELPIQ